MDQTIYGDVLFVVNFSMDFLTLFVTAKILRRRIRPGRMALAAAIGGVYGVAACFMGGWLLFRLAIHAAVALLMCYTAFGSRILPCCALFYGTGCLLGGMMTALYGWIGTADPRAAAGGSPSPAGGLPLGWMAAAAGIAGAAAVIGGRYGKRCRAAPLCEVTVTEGGKTFRFQGFTDGGNLLTDPIGGRPVILLEKAAMMKILPEPLRTCFCRGDPEGLTALTGENARRVRLIPALSIGGRTLLLGFLPETVTVSGAEKEAVLAVSPTALPDGEALVPGCLCEGSGLSHRKRGRPDGAAGRENAASRPLLQKTRPSAPENRKKEGTHEDL